MSAPSRSTRPVARAPGIVSCMRFRHRKNVDLPQPDGPMTAVTLRSGIASVTSLMACTAPKYALSSCVPRRDFAARATSGASRRVTGAFTAASSVTHAAEAGTGREAGREADEEDERDEDEGSRPGEGVPLVVGTDGIGEDLKRKGCNRLGESYRPELVAERSEEQRRGLARDTRDGDQCAGHDARRRSAKDDRQRRPPARVA